MKKIITTILLTSALPSFVSATLECRSNVCTDIQELDDLVVIPTEEDLFGSSVRELTATEEYCAISYGQNNNQPVPYDSQFSTRNGVQALGNGRFRIGGDNGPVFNLRWRGNPNSAYADINTSQLTADTPGSTSCTDTNSKASIQAAINTNDLRAISPGVYSGQMSMDMGQESTLYHQAVDFNITLPKVIKISALDNMLITEDDRRTVNNGTTYYQKNERFCVFVWGGGDYAMSATSNTQNEFLLSNGTDTIEYIVHLSTNGSGRGLQPVAPDEQVTATGGSSSLDCNNSNNARVRVRINENNVTGKSTGAYTSTLTLTVQAL